MEIKVAKNKIILAIKLEILKFYYYYY